MASRRNLRRNRRVWYVIMHSKRPVPKPQDWPLSSKRHEELKLYTHQDLRQHTYGQRED
jgi:hypothetical protein